MIMDESPDVWVKKLGLSSGAAVWAEQARLRHESTAVWAGYHNYVFDDLALLYDG